MAFKNGQYEGTTLDNLRYVTSLFPLEFVGSIKESLDPISPVVYLFENYYKILIKKEKRIPLMLKSCLEDEL